MSTHRRIAPASARVVAADARLRARLGEQVRTQRTARRWSLRELAQRAGMSVAGVHRIEAAEVATIESYLRVADALGVRLEIDLVDPRRREPLVRGAQDPVHAAMGELEAGHLRGLGLRVAIDEPYQHFQFAGRADVVAWDAPRRALLHIENRTRFPNLQEMAGSYNAKRAYLGAALAERLGVPGWLSETHVLVGLWSAEVLHTIRLRTETFRSLCPDPPEAFGGWWSGRPPPAGRASTLAVLDPFATDRRRVFVGLDQAATARPRVRGYAEAVARLGA